MRKLIVSAAMLAIMLVVAAPAMAQEGEGSANPAAISDAASQNMDDVNMDEIEKAQAVANLVSTRAVTDLFEADTRDSRAVTIYLLAVADLFKVNEAFFQQDALRVALANYETMQDLGFIGADGAGGLGGQAGAR